MSGNVKYTKKIFLIILMYIKSNEHTNTWGEEKRDFNSKIKKGEIISFWLYITTWQSRFYTM